MKAYIIMGGIILFLVILAVALVVALIDRNKAYHEALCKKNEIQQELYKLRDEISLRSKADEESKEKLAEVASGGINAALAILREH